MGHFRLGNGLPDTRPWRKVVACLADGDAAGPVAAATTEAAAAGLDAAVGDPGIARVVFLLARTALAARAGDFRAALAVPVIDVRVPPEPTLFDLTAALADARLRWHQAEGIARSDLAEMAGLAAAEAVTRCVGERAAALVPTGREVHDAVRRLSTPAGFGHLAHEFFARFARRFLHYHLDRELSHHVGGNGRFVDRDARRGFAADLDTHCREAAVIVRRYAGEWYSKARFEDGVSEAAAKRFAITGMRKLRAELLRRGVPNG